MVEAGRAILAKIELEGFSCTEFKFDERDGVYKLLEVNGRHNLSSLLSIRCGMNFPWISYRHLVAGERPGPIRPRTGLYWNDEWLELSFNRSRAGRDGETGRQILRPWVREHVFSVFDPTDPGPSRLLARQILRDAARVVARTVGRRSERA